MDIPLRSLTGDGERTAHLCTALSLSPEFQTPIKKELIFYQTASISPYNTMTMSSPLCKIIPKKRLQQKLNLKKHHFAKAKNGMSKQSWRPQKDCAPRYNFVWNFNGGWLYEMGLTKRAVLLPEEWLGAAGWQLHFTRATFPILFSPYSSSSCLGSVNR